MRRITRAERDRILADLKRRQEEMQANNPPGPTNSKPAEYLDDEKGQ